MERTTIMLPKSLKFRVARRAKEQGMSLGEFVRSSLEQKLRTGTRADLTGDPLLDDDFVSDDPGPSDVAERHDEYLYEDMLEERRRWSNR